MVESRSKKASDLEPPRFGAGEPAVPDDDPLAAGVPLGRVLPSQLVESPEIVMRGAARSVAAEKFRRLKTLLDNDEAGAARVIVVTSATPREGKSLVAVNLALAFASDQKAETLLVDADLRRPSVGRFFTPAPGVGFAEILEGKVDVEHALVRLKDVSLKVLPAGHPPRDPVDLLSSDRCRTLVAALRERYHRVIIDTPPIVPFTDADAVGRSADGILIVVRAGQTPKSVYLQAISAVTSTRILGTVLNDVVFNIADRDRYYGKYYNHYYGTGKKEP
jgi:capsular exopolysaccharide synthesis family protein